jgi:hypothetical protein
MNEPQRAQGLSRVGNVDQQDPHGRSIGRKLLGFSVGLTPSVALENMEPSVWPAVRRIYREGIDAGRATFETQTPDWVSFQQPS